jgi:hypothetical protein
MPLGGIGQESLKWFGTQLENGNKMKIETRIEEPLNSMDYWENISAIPPLTPRFHASEVSLLIDFEN